MADEVVPGWVPRGRTGSGRGLDIRHRPITNAAFHLPDHTHFGVSPDFIGNGAATLGPVAYSLLRAESFSLYEHRGKHVGSSVAWLRGLAARAEKIARIDPLGGRKLFRQNAPLYIWDLIGLVYETCEHLACVFDSLSRYRAGSAPDLGVAMLDYAETTLHVFDSPAFNDLTWWQAELGTVPDPARFAMLSPLQQRLMVDSRSALDTRLALAIATIREIYTDDLHRIAVRRRHSVSLLDAERGLAWISADHDEGASDAQALADGALAVADKDRRGGFAVELLLPISSSLINDLVGCLHQARWLVHTLSWATLSRAENPSHLPFVFDEDLPLQEDLSADWDSLMCTYTGIEPSALEEERKAKQRRSEVIGAAERVAPANNRATRREASRQSRKRRGR